jgi:hypothetical protein
MSDKAKRTPFKGERKFALGLRAGQNRCVKADWKKLQELALAEIEATLAALPKPLREQAQKLPVTFEKAPNAGLQADGIESDTLGLFAGAEFADDSGAVLSPQIILFLEKAIKRCFATKFTLLFCTSWDIFLVWGKMT